MRLGWERLGRDGKVVRLVGRRTKMKPHVVPTRPNARRGKTPTCSAANATLADGGVRVPGGLRRLQSGWEGRTPSGGFDSRPPPPPNEPWFACAVTCGDIGQGSTYLTGWRTRSNSQPHELIELHGGALCTLHVQSSPISAECAPALAGGWRGERSRPPDNQVRRAEFRTQRIVT
jgi:hypothetical protein